MDSVDAVSTTVPVRYRDLDPLGHVNHAVYTSYLEEARLSYFDSVLEVSLDRVDHVIAALDIEFRQRIEYGDELVVTVGVSEIGTTSLTTAYELRVDGELVATASVVLVTYDREAGKPRPVPDDWRARIERFEGGF